VKLYDEISVEDQIEEEILGCLQFVTNYRDRFGHGPNFFEGTLEDAMKAACSTKSAKDVSFCFGAVHKRKSDFFESFSCLKFYMKIKIDRFVQNT
jgi:hypothetical protein